MRVQRFWGPIAGGTILMFVLGTIALAQTPKAEHSGRPHLGVTLGPPTAGEKGALIREVTPDSPAAKAGLKEGDRVLKIGDQEVSNADGFIQAVASHKPGDKVSLHISRSGQEQDIEVTLGERSAEQESAHSGPSGMPGFPGGRRPAFLGVQTQQLTPEVKNRLGVKADAGIVVIDVVAKSPATMAGLKSNDVITAVNDQTIKDPAQLREIVQQVGPGKEVALQVTRGNENLTLKAKLTEASFGMFLTPGNDRYPMLDVESMADPNHRVRELERRIEELEKRINELEKKQK